MKTEQSMVSSWTAEEIDLLVARFPSQPELFPEIQPPKREEAVSYRGRPKGQDIILVRVARDNGLLNLNRLEMRIIEARYLFAEEGHLTQAELGREFGISRERIRQRESKVLKKLRDRVKAA